MVSTPPHLYLHVSVFYAVLSIPQGATAYCQRVRMGLGQFSWGCNEPGNFQLECAQVIQVSMVPQLCHNQKATLQDSDCVQTLIHQILFQRQCIRKL